ncbi:MAG: response regulator [Planctomycetota bacterium]
MQPPRDDNPSMGKAQPLHAGSSDPSVSQNGEEEALADKKVFTTGEAAQLCKVSQQTIIRCFDSGRLQGFRVPGSRFRRIPREELLKFMRANGIPTETLDPGPKRILVVDDDPGIVSLLEDLLGRDRRFQVRSAATGYDAGLLTEAFRPHAVVLDYMLPDLNGDLVCRRLREHDHHAETRVVFVSGVIEDDEVDRLMQAGADAFLKKPFDISQLVGKLEELLNLAQ